MRWPCRPSRRRPSSARSSRPGTTLHSSCRNATPCRPAWTRSGLLAIFAARSFDIPLSFRASYCFSFFTFAHLLGTAASFGWDRKIGSSGSLLRPAARKRLSRFDDVGHGYFAGCGRRKGSSAGLRSRPGSGRRHDPRAAAVATGRTADLDPQPDHGETSYEGHGRLAGKAALITGADSGIGRAVAIAFAREGADVVISYLDEHDDARTTADWVERAGRRAELAPGDIADPAHCRALVERTVDAFGRVDVLVNNAAFQRTYEQLEDIPDDEWERHWQTNVSAMFHLCKAALPHMQRGASIVNTASVNADQPKPTLLPYATTKGAIVELQRRAGAAARAARHPRQLGAARPDLDAADPVDDAARPGRGLRQRHAARPPGPAGRARARLRAARLRRVELRDRLRVAVTGGRPVL